MTTSTLIRIPVSSFRKLESPYEESGKKLYLSVVSVKDIPMDLDNWMDLNPRSPNINSGVAKKIAETLEDCPESFLFKNRGITLLADSVRFDNKQNIVEIEMVDRKRNGLLDGGHTFRVIRNLIEGLPPEELTDYNAFVKLEILEGFKELDDAVAIVDSRNTSIQVREEALEELRRHYEEIKKVLEGREYADRIAYKTNELEDDGSRKDIDIKEILSYITCFDVEKFDSKIHPIIAYSSKSAVVEHFKDNRERLLKYVPLLPKILELRDEIYLGLPEAYNSEGGKFGGLTGVLEVSARPRMLKTPLHFLGKESSYRIPSSFIYPVLAAFRNLVQCNDKKCTWKTDPSRLFREIKTDLAIRVGEQAKEMRNPTKLGKDNATWGRCYDLVELETLKRGF